MKRIYLTIVLMISLVFVARSQTYLPLTAGSGNPLTGTLFSNYNVLFAQNFTGTTGDYGYFQNTGGHFYLGKESSVAGAVAPGTVSYGNFFYSDNTAPFQFVVNNHNVLNIFDSNVGIGTTTPNAILSLGMPVVSALKTYTTDNQSGISPYIVSTGDLGGYLDIFASRAGDGTSQGGSTIRFLNQGYADTSPTGIERMRIAQNGYVGIGTAAPSSALDVQGNTPGNVVLNVQNNGAGRGVIQVSSGSTSTANLTFMNQGTAKYTLLSTYSGGLGFFDEGASIYSMYIAPTSGFVGIGTASPDEKLTVNGTVHSTEVKVTPGPLPDYVFDKAYHLPTLSEVKTYVDKNHHLPDVPSASEVEKNGLKLGEMNATLLKKVEELTLYLIDQQKINARLQQQINQLKKKTSKQNKNH